MSPRFSVPVRMDSHITVTGVHSIGKNAGFCNDIQQKI